MGSRREARRADGITPAGSAEGQRTDVRSWVKDEGFGLQGSSLVLGIARFALAQWPRVSGKRRYTIYMYISHGQSLA